MSVRPFLVFALLATRALANQVCVSASIPLQPVNWNQPVTLTRFDPTLGTLTSVSIEITAVETGAVAIESLDSIPIQVSTQFSSQASVRRPDNSLIASAMPSVSFVDNLTSFDGTVDFAGTSGVTHASITAQATAQAISSQVTDLALFTGPAGTPGNITLPVDCVGTSIVVGSVTVSQFTMQASAVITVCYDYISPHVSFCLGDGSATACPCGNASAVGAGEGCASSLGHGARLAGSGLASVANDTFVLSCTDLPATTNALFFQGTAQQSGGAGAVFGDGLRCVAGSIVRLHAVTASSGVAVWPPAGGPHISVTGAVQPNTARHYQTWYRNAASFCTPSTFNLSQGLTVMWAP